MLGRRRGSRPRPRDISVPPPAFCPSWRRLRPGNDANRFFSASFVTLPCTIPRLCPKSSVWHRPRPTPNRAWRSPLLCLWTFPTAPWPPEKDGSPPPYPFHDCLWLRRGDRTRAKPPDGPLVSRAQGETIFPLRGCLPSGGRYFPSPSTEAPHDYPARWLCYRRSWLRANRTRRSRPEYPKWYPGSVRWPRGQLWTPRRSCPDPREFWSARHRTLDSWDPTGWLGPARSRLDCWQRSPRRTAPYNNGAWLPAQAAIWFSTRAEIRRCRAS